MHERESLKRGMWIAAIGLLLATPVLADEAAMNARFEQLERKVDSQERELKDLRAAEAPGDRPTVSDTTIGGYGEASYTAYKHEASRNQADLRRFVLFVGHRFSEKWSFDSEVEWEHTVTSSEDAGETAIEQAYVNYQFRPGMNIKTGLFLMPFGFINESHEPPVFYGVDRNEVETRIIPSTWREGGMVFDGTTPFGLRASLGLVTGFDISKFDDPARPLSSVHQELSLARARDVSYYGALNYQGVPGLLVGGAAFHGRSGHKNAAFREDPAQPNLAGIDAEITLYEAHTRWQGHGLDLQALFAEGLMAQAGAFDTAIAKFNTATGEDRPFAPKRFNGWLTQAAYIVWQSGDASLAPFVRYEAFDTQAKLPDGITADPANKDWVTTAGFSLKPVSSVVFKADYHWNRRNTHEDRFNLGVGYMF